MVGRFCLHILVLGLFASGAFAAPGSSSSDAAEPSTDHEKKEDRTDRDGDGRDRERGDSDRGYPGKFRERLEKMSPEERKHFEENWKRWKEMDEHERKEWQRRAAEARARMEKAVAETLAKLDLALEGERREEFAHRYRKERKKIEEQLCKEMDDRRDALIEEMHQRLKVEFSAPVAPAQPPAAGN